MARAPMGQSPNVVNVQLAKSEIYIVEDGSEVKDYDVNR